MFNFLTFREKSLLFIGPIILILIIIFQGWQANHWRMEATKEEQLKLQWQAQYNDMAHSIDEFNRQAAKLTQAVQNLQAQQGQQTKELNHALQKNQNWSNQPVPDDVSRLFKRRHSH